MSNKTIQDAVKELPKQVQALFVQIFEQCNTLDLYDGDLELYFQVVLQVITQQREIIWNLRNAVSRIKDQVDISATL